MMYSRTPRTGAGCHIVRHMRGCGWVCLGYGWWGMQVHTQGNRLQVSCDTTCSMPSCMAQYDVKKQSQYLTDYVNAFYQAGAMEAFLARAR